jgi:hypothetical protein
VSGNSSNSAENWTQDYSTFYWSSRDPFEEKFQMEKTLGLLLKDDPLRRAPLVYSGSDNPPFLGRDVQLRFEAALPNGNWYSLHIAAWVPRTWETETEFRTYADRSFNFWTFNLQTAPTLGALNGASQDLYDSRVKVAAEKEAIRASQREDQEPIRALKKQILDELREGKSFRTVHHEGGTYIYFDGNSYVWSTYGEEVAKRDLTSEDETLQSIRDLYDWESRKSSYPHPPPELEVWTFIHQQMR